MSARLRVYQTGTVCLEYGGMVVDERQLPARQGRLVLTYLIGERSRPVTRDELGDAIWSDTLPTAWESALREASEAGPSSAPGGPPMWP